MRRQIVFFILIAQLLLSATICGFAQQTPGQQSPSVPDDVLGSQLIAWSQLQQPEPVVQGQSQEQQQFEPSSFAQTFTDCTNTDRTDQDRSAPIPSVTNCVTRSRETTTKH